MTQRTVPSPRQARRIVGVDPGLAVCGYGVIEADGPALRMVEFGAVRTTPDTAITERIAEIYRAISEVFERNSPDACAVETLFFAKNAKVAFQVGHVRGALLLGATLQGIPVFEYTPLQIKQAVAGYGRAEKPQIQYMVKMLLGLDAPPKPPDAADALAVAVTHANTQRLAMMTGQAAPLPLRGGRK